jgi:glutaminyl-peptide cyclotransferase
MSLRKRLSGLLIGVSLLSALGAAADTEHPRAGAFEAQRAMQHIHALLAWVPRSMGSPGHARALEYIEEQLRSDPHIELVRQNWAELAPDGQTTGMTNLIARLNPQLKQRVLLATHYDSIVRAYRDPDPTRRSLPMPGANNSASGVAVLIEMARVLSHERPPVGVDFIFFDGEEGPLSLGAGDRNWRALGSPYFGKHIGELYGSRLPELALVFDMVCKRDIRLYPERSSLESAPKGIEALWGIGKRLAPANFLISPPTGVVLDDQTALAGLGIPSILLIDFNYEPWFNTTEDTEDKCSQESLQAVGGAATAFTLSQLRGAGH